MSGSYRPGSGAAVDDVGVQASNGVRVGELTSSDSFGENEDSEDCEHYEPRARPSEEEYDRRTYGIFQALPVPEGEPDWDSGPPTSAEEYLRRVRWEAARCPQVVRAELPPHVLTTAADGEAGANVSSPDIAAAPEWARPCAQWLNEFVHDFSTLRAQLQQADEAAELSRIVPDVRLPNINDWMGWDHLCFGRTAQNAINSDNSPIPAHVLNTLLAMEQVEVVMLLQRHIDQTQDLDTLTPARCHWLFALAAKVAKPVHAEVGAAFRALLRKCAALRAELTGPNDPSLPHLNVLIAVAGAYFGQDQTLLALLTCEPMP